MKIGIVGAGIMGRLLAFSLVNAGHRIHLYERDKTSRKNCSMAAAGMLSPVTELGKCGRLIYELGLPAMETHWPSIISRLQKEIYFRRNGSLVVSHPHDEAELMNFISQIENKVHLSSHYQKVDADKLMTLEPELVKFQQAYYLPEEGQLDNQALMHALKSDLEPRVDWTIFSVKDMTQTRDQHDLLIDCRGMGARDRFDDLHAVRGELIWLHAPDVNLARPIRFMHPRYSIYIVPRPNNIYLIGASEIYAKDYSTISVRSTLELLSAAYYVHPAFAEARIIKTVTHCRPALPDHLPKIKFSKDCIAINGLYRHGFLIAPTLADEVTRWIAHGQSALQYPQLWEFS